jgi:UDP-N-acetyl-D-mannosaminuronate dehydrogenase
VVDLIRRILGEVSGKKVTILGLAYKPDVDDLRESPAVEVAHKLAQVGMSVTAFEPFKPDFVLPGVFMATTLDEAVNQAEIIVLLVNHSDFRSLEPFEFARITPARIILDTVGAWEPEIWRAAGFETHRLGVSERE